MQVRSLFSATSVLLAWAMVLASGVDENYTKKKSGAVTLEVVSGASVRIYYPGATIRSSSGSPGTTIPLYSSSRIRVGDVLDLEGQTATVLTVPDGISITVDAALVFSQGQRLLRSSSPVTAYYDDSFTEPITQPMTADSSGRLWFYVRNTSFDLKATNSSGYRFITTYTGAYSQTLVASDYATSGDGSESDPWIGWEEVVNAAAHCGKTKQATVSSSEGSPSTTVPVSDSSNLYTGDEIEVAGQSRTVASVPDSTSFTVGSAVTFASGGSVLGWELYPSCEVYFPPGVYECSSSNCLGAISNGTGDKLWGIRFRGAGMHQSVIRLDPDAAADVWFFDNCVNPPDCFDHCSTTTSTECSVDGDCPGGETCVSGATPTFLAAQFDSLGFEGKRVCTGAAPQYCLDGDSTKLYGSISDYHNGFRIVSSNKANSWEQKWSFRACRFSMLDKGFELHGTNTASEFSFVDDFFDKLRGVVYYVRNQQSINHNFVSVDIENVFDDMFVFTPALSGSGGGFFAWGGSWIFSRSNNAGDPTDMRYVFKSDGGGSSVSRVLFDGIFYELRGDYTGLVDTSASDALWDITFSNSKGSFAYNTVDRVVNAVGPATTLNFENFNWKLQSEETCDAPTGNCSGVNALEWQECDEDGDCSGSGSVCTKPTHQCGPITKFYADERDLLEGMVYFKNNLVPEDWETYLDWTDRNHGRAECSGCYWGPGSVTCDDVSCTRIAHDFVRRMANVSGRNQGGMVLKSATMVADWECWPYWKTATSAFVCERRLTLPRNSTIVNIRGWRPIGNGDSAGGLGCWANTEIQYNVGTDDKGTAWLTTTSAQQRLESAWSYTNLNKKVGADNTIRFWATPNTGTFQECKEGYVVVDYY